MSQPNPKPFEDIPETSTPQSGLPLTLRKPSELLSMAFDDSDLILGDRLMARGQSFSMLGAGGIGKSRISIQLAAAINTGRNFLTLPTHNGPLKWFFLQTENSNRRLQHDLRHVQAWLGDDWPLFADYAVFHTIETDKDMIVSLDLHSESVRQAIKAAEPEAIVWDPLNSFAIGDLNKDADMRETLMAVSSLSREGNPNRAIVVCHHALTGRAGAVKATGYERASFGRNSKVLQAWTRGQMNIAPATPDNNERLIFACGKCSNGKEFETFGAVFNTSTMVYEVDKHFDVESWQADMGAKPTGPRITPEQAAALLEHSMAKAEWAKAIMRESGVGRTRAYDIMTNAETKGFAHYSKVERKYARRIER